jgi:Xaa-Pro aminopeptidase
MNDRNEVIVSEVPVSTSGTGLSNGSVLGPEHSALSAERRAEIEAKQERVAELLAEARADGLLLIDPANIAWLAGASLNHGITDAAEWPALYLVSNQRWLVCGSTDTQRLFDAHLDGLGFQLKEWPWHWGRDRLLTDLCQNRRVASDRLLAGCVPVGPTLRRIRCALTPEEQGRLRDLGARLAHALEATSRHLEPGQTEDEVAGQLAHRLLHRGVQPVALSVAGDGRVGCHRRPGVAGAAVRQWCVVAATAARSGLHATAARTVWLGPIDPAVRTEFDAACRTLAALAAASTPGTPAAAAVEAGRRVAHLGGHDDAWLSGPPGHVTGWQPVERPLAPTSSLTLEANWAVTWQAGVGPALCCDTYLVAAPPACVTPVESWPVKRVHVQNMVVDVPDILERKSGG